MQTHPSSALLSYANTPTGIRSKQRAHRTAQAAALTACLLAIGLGFGVLLGGEAAVLAMLTMPVPLVLLWASTDVRRSDEAQ
jgi:hypothetical protein